MVNSFYVDRFVYNFFQKKFAMRKRKKTFPENARSTKSGDVIKKPISDSILLMVLGTIRILNVVLVVTWFVPDEYWQSLEVAHKLVFGYGHLTWEWNVGIRSFIHPLLFAAWFYVIKLCRLSDYVTVLTIGPRIIQAALSVAGEFCFFKFVTEQSTDDVARWTLFSIVTSWFWWFCATRTLVNSAEAALVCVALYFYPIGSFRNGFGNSRKSLKVFVFVSILAAYMRPTSATVWCPLYIWYLFDCFRYNDLRKFARICFEFMTWACIICIFMVSIDCYCYGDLRLVHYNFVRFNLLENRGTFYGSHPWHWYFTQGIPAVLGPHLPLVLLGVVKALYERRHFELCLLVVISFTLVVYSFAGHKEFRFLLSILPMLLYFSGSLLSDLSHPRRRATLVFLLITNSILMIYTGLIHQGAPLKVVNFLRGEVATSSTQERVSALFLLPCHSTPYYSHIHSNVPLRFLTCEPDFTGRGDDYLDEAEIFFADPNLWIQSNLFSGEIPFHSSACNSSLPRFLVLYDVLLAKLSLLGVCYREKFAAFHSHFPEGKVGRSMLVLERV